MAIISSKLQFVWNVLLIARAEQAGRNDQQKKGHGNITDMGEEP